MTGLTGLDGWVTTVPYQSRVMRPQSTLDSFDRICAKVPPGQKWRDPNPPMWTKDHVTKRLPLQWLTPRELYGDGVDIAMFKPDPKTPYQSTVTFSDPKQGDVGNCWFISALAIVAKASPATIKRALTKSNAEKGVYEFTFYDECLRQTVHVCVDERLPVHTGERCMVYCHSATAGELWPSLIEKAFAKAYGSYTITEMGSNAIGVSNLTSKPSEVYLSYYNRALMSDPDALWTKLLSLYASRNVVGVSFIPQPGQVKYPLDLDPGSKNWWVRNHEVPYLISGHAYSVLSVHEVLDAGAEVRLVRIRNPWGRRAEWQGDWSDKSGKWSSRLKAQVPFSELGDKDGVFFMSIEDLARNVNCVSACQY
jgi:hypothetical protein